MNFLHNYNLDSYLDCGPCFSYAIFDVSKDAFFLVLSIKYERKWVYAGMQMKKKDFLFQDNKKKIELSSERSTLNFVSSFPLKFMDKPQYKAGRAWLIDKKFFNYSRQGPNQSIGEVRERRYLSLLSCFIVKEIERTFAQEVSPLWFAFPESTFHKIVFRRCLNFSPQE